MDARQAVTPRPRSPMPATLAPSLKSERVVVSDAVQAQYGLRAWSDVYTLPNGQAVVDVVTEEAWWRFRILAELPRFQRWPADDVWVE